MANTISVYKEERTWGARISARDENGVLMSAFAAGRTPADAIINLGFSLLGEEFPFDPSTPPGRIKLHVEETE